MTLIYKIAPAPLWAAAVALGRFDGAPIDRADGFIHFSTREQVEETAERHFAGQADLVLVAFESETLGEKLVFEPSRGGALFPHLYAPLPTAKALFARPLPLRGDGRHDFSGI